MDESSPIQVTEQGDTLRLAWDNRRVRKDNVTFGCFIVFLMVWVPVTLLVTCVIFIPGAGVGERIFCLLWSSFAWFGTLAILYSIRGRYWSEWIEISNESLSYGRTGFWARKPKTFPLDTIVELGCGWYSSAGEHESIMTLNIFRANASWFRRRTIFGYWLAPKIKVQVFETIAEFVRRHQIPLELIKYHPDFGRGPVHKDVALPSATIPKDESLPIEVTEDGETLRVQWDNRRLPKHKFLFVIFVIFWLAFAPATVVVTYQIIAGNEALGLRVFMAIWCLFGWPVTLGFPYLLIFQRYRTEWIEISPTSVSHGFMGFLARKPKTFALDTIVEIGIGENDSFGISHGDSIHPGTHSWGYWLTPKVKEQIFQAVEEFVTKKRIPLRMTRYEPSTQPLIPSS